MLSMTEYVIYLCTNFPTNLELFSVLDAVQDLSLASLSTKRASAATTATATTPTTPTALQT